MANIYVAGPFTEDPDTWTEICRGIGYTLMSLGFNVIVPHMATGAWDGTDLHYEDYMRLDLNIIERWADAIYLVAESPGSLREAQLCKQLGIPVLTTWREIYEYYNRHVCERETTSSTQTTDGQEGEQSMVVYGPEISRPLAQITDWDSISLPKYEPEHEGYWGFNQC